MISQYITLIYSQKLQGNTELAQLQAEREALRVKAESYKGRARGRVIPKAYQLDREIKALKNPSFKDKLIYIGGGAPPDKTFINIFNDYLNDLASIENLRVLFSFDSLGDFVDNAEQTINEAKLNFTQTSRAQKGLTTFIYSVLDSFTLEELQQELPSMEGFKFTSTSKQQLMEGLASSIQQGTVRFYDKQLITELETFEFEYTRTGVRYSAPEGLHDDGVCALALATMKLKTNTLGFSIGWVDDE
jgi:hypothetical protein